MTSLDLKSLRRAAGMSQEDLANALGITRGWVSHREAGHRTISRKDALAIESILSGQVRAKTVRRTSRKSK